MQPLNTPTCPQTSTIILPKKIKKSPIFPPTFFTLQKFSNFFQTQIFSQKLLFLKNAIYFLGISISEEKCVYEKFGFGGGGIWEI